MSKVFSYAVWIAAVLCFGSAVEVCAAPVGFAMPVVDAAAEVCAAVGHDSIVVEFQRRGSSNHLIVFREKIDPSTVGVVVIDMWNWHWCKTNAGRDASMMPRMNKCLEGARKLGMQVFFCPTDVANNYAGTIQRERALAYP